MAALSKQLLAFAALSAGAIAPAAYASDCTKQFDSYVALFSPEDAEEMRAMRDAALSRTDATEHFVTFLNYWVLASAVDEATESSDMATQPALTARRFLALDDWRQCTAGRLPSDLSPDQTKLLNRFDAQYPDQKIEELRTQAEALL